MSAGPGQDGVNFGMEAVRQTLAGDILGAGAPTVVFSSSDGVVPRPAERVDGRLVLELGAAQSLVWLVE